MSQIKICLNCSQPLLKEDRYCRTCGQKSDTQRFTIKKILSEVFHSITHTDKNIFGLIAGLATKPGIVASEYVAGKRKSYFNPFIFLVLCLAFFVFMNAKMGFLGPEPVVDTAYVEQLRTEAEKQLYLARMEKQANAYKFLQKNSNLLGMLAVPFFSLFTWLFIKKGKWNYAEHIVGNIMFIAFANLIFTLFITPLMGITANTPSYFIFLSLGLFLQAVYVGWAQYQFNGKPGTGYFFYCFFIGLAATASWGVLANVVMMLYVML